MSRSAFLTWYQSAVSQMAESKRLSVEAANTRSFPAKLSSLVGGGKLRLHEGISDDDVVDENDEICSVFDVPEPVSMVCTSGVSSDMEELAALESQALAAASNTERTSDDLEAGFNALAGFKPGLKCRI